MYSITRVGDTSFHNKSLERCANFKDGEGFFKYICFMNGMVVLGSPHQPNNKLIGEDINQVQMYRIIFQVFFQKLYLLKVFL
jgi:hypothetical protein